MVVAQPPSVPAPPRHLPKGDGSREELLRLVRAHPGIHPRGLCRATGLGWGTVNYHLAILERTGRIRIRAGRPLKLFCAEVPPSEERRLLRLHDGTDRRIMDLLVERPGLDVAVLSRQLRVARRTLQRRLSTLVAAGLVVRAGAYRSRFFAAAWTLAHATPAAESPEGAGPA